MEKLKELRKKAGYKQEVIAQVLGVKREMISHYENGTRKISLTNLSKLLKFYGITLKEFEGNELEIKITCNVNKNKFELEDIKALIFVNNFINNLYELKKIVEEEQ